MKKKCFVVGCVVAIASTLTAQVKAGKVVVFIPQTNACYEASAISTSSDGKTLTLKMKDAVEVKPTADRMKLANACTKGEFRNDDVHGGTHNVECDVTVAVTCFCTGVK